MTRSSLIRNVAVFGSLSVMLLALGGCPGESQRAASDQAKTDSGSDTTRVESTPQSNELSPSESRPESPRAEPILPPEEPAVELPEAPALVGEPAEESVENPEAVPPEGERGERRGEQGDLVGSPAEQEDGEEQRDVQDDNSAEADDAQGIELFAPRNGSAAARQAPVREAYAAEQPAAKQPLFEDWPQPQAALVISGRQHGYIEPCGCTGLANQKGGMARRHTFLKQLLAKDWPVAPIDAGNQVRRFGRQAEIKFQMTATAMRTLSYRAVGLGPDDLRLSFGELIAPVIEEGPDGGSMFVSANVNLLDQIPGYRVFTVGGKKIGVTTVLGKQAQQEVNAAEIELTNPAEALTQVMPQLKSADCDLLLLLAQASEEECAALAQKFPAFQIIVSADNASEPSHDFLPIEGSKAKLVKIGAKGMHAVVIGMFDHASKPLRYQRVPLDDRFTDSAEMLKLLASYQGQLEALGLEGLGLRPVSHPSGATFVGSSTCADCHTTAYEIWKKTPHAHATDSLVHPGERVEIPRHFDPECLSCHVTGWNPQGYYPYQSGYLDLAESKQLHGNGCENCHGPGSKHVAVEMGEVTVTDQQQQMLREGMRLTLDEAKKNKCMTCHDLDNSPDFHKPGAFERYWKEVEHKGVD